LYIRLAALSIGRLKFFTQLKRLVFAQLGCQENLLPGAIGNKPVRKKANAKLARVASMKYSTVVPKIEQRVLYSYCAQNLNSEKKKVESPGIDPGASRMLSERSTI
jgi:hypothetical protein